MLSREAYPFLYPCNYACYAKRVWELARGTGSMASSSPQALLPHMGINKSSFFYSVIMCVLTNTTKKNLVTIADLQ